EVGDNFDFLISFKRRGYRFVTSSFYFTLTTSLIRNTKQMRLRFIWCVFLFAGEIHFALSQTIDSESNRFSERAIQEMYQIYVDFSLRQMLLYNGIKYDEVARNPDVDFGHPFYLMDNV